MCKASDYTGLQSPPFYPKYIEIDRNKEIKMRFNIAYSLEEYMFKRCCTMKKKKCSCC